MKKFKTNIKCAACIEKVTPLLNEAVGEGNWQVDITDPAKILSIEGEQSEAAINEALNQKGYRAETVNK
jgi:hypothetical protein